MVFLLTAIDDLGEVRDFTCHLDTLERGFDLLSNIATMGHTLVKAQVMDEYHLTNLPTEAFDGSSFSAAMEELKNEWNAILHEPMPRVAYTIQERIAHAQRQLDYYENRIVSYELLITKLVALLERSLKMKSTRDGASAINSHYESTIERYRTQLVKSYLVRHQLLERLRCLEA